MPLKYAERLNLSIFAVMCLRFSGLTQEKIARKLTCSVIWVKKVCALPKYKDQYPTLRKQIAENYLIEQIKKNPEENLIKWYPKLVTDMKDAADGRIKNPTRIKAIYKLFEVAKEYKDKERETEEEVRPIMSDEKADEMHSEIKQLIKLHGKLIEKLNKCPRENLIKTLKSS